MNIGILGSGLMGAKLGTIFARAGHKVMFSYSRDRKKLDELAKAAGHGATAGTPREAVQHAELVFIAVNWWHMDDLLAQAGDLSGKIVACCALPMNTDNTALVVAHTSSGAETLAARMPKANFVQAYNTVPSEVLFDVYENRAKPPRPSLLYCGDDATAKKVVAGLIRDTGFEPIDIGGLKMARYSEPFTMIVAELAYGGYGMAKESRLAYRFELFG